MNSGGRVGSDSSGGSIEDHPHNPRAPLDSVSRSLLLGSHHLNAFSIIPHISMSHRDPTQTTTIPTSCSSSNSNIPNITNNVPISSPGLSSIPQAGDNNSVDLTSLFECPVCMDYALPPILQCQSGHIVCAPCRSKLSTCPTCRGSLDNIRNLAMEKLAASVLFPCKFSTSGCPETLHYSAKSDHESLCEYRPYECPCPGASCKWVGDLDGVLNHLVQNHKSITILQGEDIVFLATDINLPGAVDWVMMQSCFGHNFMLVLEKQERPPGQIFYALVQLIGSRKQAEQFTYKLELIVPNRRLTWETSPLSIHDGVQSAIAVSDCLVFDSNTAQTFSDNGNLGINVTISKSPSHLTLNIIQ